MDLGVQCTTRTLFHSDSSLPITIDVRTAIDSKRDRDKNGEQEQGQPQQLPIVVFIHGFRVHKDWGFIPRVCAALARSGAHVVSYNSRYNGYSGEHSEHFSEDVFALNTIEKELEDAHAIVSAAENHTLLPSGYSSNGEIMMVGHSRGSAIALLTAAGSQSISACALWSPIARLNRYTERQKQLWRARGYVRVPESDRGPAFRMNVEFLDDLEQHRDAYSLTHAMKTFSGASAIIVGTQDLATPPAEARELFAAAPLGRCFLTEIPATGHTFGMPDYDAPLSPACMEAVRVTTDVFNAVSSRPAVHMNGNSLSSTT